MTTVGLADTSTYTTMELISRLVAISACTYGSEGWGFESLRARRRSEALSVIVEGTSVRCLTTLLTRVSDDSEPSAAADLRVVAITVPG
jgi:hypothetical protein